MDSPSSSSSSPSPSFQPDFHGFLARMRSPAAADLVRGIKRFIVSFSFHPTDAENDSRKLQDFLMTMETNIRKHPLWAQCTDVEINNALEGLEKYIMTKLFNRTFTSPEDAKSDMYISEKICLLQHFIKLDHLDVPKVLQSEAALLFAAKELQKINAFKAPREKLLCVMNCCRVINNLLLKVSLSTNHIPAGADDFLPVLIYVTIRANPTQLHSNLKYIQHFRWHPKLVSEEEYYLTNLISAKSFIENLDASSLSIEVSEFQKNMQAARLAVKGIIFEPSNMPESSNDKVSSMRRNDEEIHVKDSYPFMDKEAEELSEQDVQKLLGKYKQVVNRYTMLSKALRQLNLDENKLLKSSHKWSGIADTEHANSPEKD